MGVKQSMSLGLLWFLVLQASLLLCITAQNNNYVLEVKEESITRLCETRTVLMVNGSIPGPNITVTRGETINVTVINSGLYPITIHWHGVKQHRNPWSDGPEYITQKPILSGKTFVYTLVFTDEEGTLWWHSHSDRTRATVYGAIIVLPEEDEFGSREYPFETPDDTKTIILGSWFNYNTSDLVTEYHDALEKGSNTVPLALLTLSTAILEKKVLLVSIRSTYKVHNLNTMLADTYNTTVTRDKTYLLRIINAAMEEEMFFAISGHTFTVVGHDGAYITPIPTDYIMITPGQTMDILLTTNQTSRSYYMGGSTFLHTGNNNPAPENLRNGTRATLVYDGSSDQLDTLDELLPASTNVTAANAFTSRIRSLKSYPEIKVPQDLEITRRFIITLTVNQIPCPAGRNCTGPVVDGVAGMRSGAFNNQRFVHNETYSILKAYYCNISGVYTENFPDAPERFNWTGGPEGGPEEIGTSGTRVMTVEYGDAVEMVFQGTNVGNPQNHPLHIHGYNFYLVANGTGNFPTSGVVYNNENPADLNTFGVHTNGWIAFRFWATNPGVWFLHCHLERHALWGMAGVLIVKPLDSTDEDQTLRAPPTEDYCST